MMKTRIKALLVVATVFVTLICGCSRNKPDDPVTLDTVNQSSVNVSEGFFQSVFTEDKELFAACFPESFTEDTGSVDAMYEGFQGTLADGYSYEGATMSAYNDYVEEDGYDLTSLKSDVSALHNIAEEDIEEAQIVKLRLFFNTVDDGEATMDVYILVYKADSSWYVFELQNSDAEFAA